MTSAPTKMIPLEPVFRFLMRTIDLLVQHGARSTLADLPGYEPDDLDVKLRRWMLARPDCTQRMRAMDRGDASSGVCTARGALISKQPQPPRQNKDSSSGRTTGPAARDAPYPQHPRHVVDGPRHRHRARAPEPHEHAQIDVARPPRRSRSVSGVKRRAPRRRSKSKRTDATSFAGLSYPKVTNAAGVGARNTSTNSGSGCFGASSSSPFVRFLVVLSAQISTCVSCSWGSSTTTGVTVFLTGASVATGAAEDPYLRPGVHHDPCPAARFVSSSV